MTPEKITISAIVEADNQKVWNCYTLPEHITKWNFADPSWHCPSATNDLRKGGKYVAQMAAKDGSFSFDFEAVYDDITEYSKLAYTMADGRQATVDFRAHNDYTEVTITFDAEQQNPDDMQRNGWQAILKAYTESI